MSPLLFLQVRLLADLLLGRLGFAALVVHLEPVAATFGNGTTSACVVSIGSSSSTVCCIDDAVVLQPPSSRLSLPIGLAGIAAALTGWMSCYGQWPQPLQQQGLGVVAASGTSSRTTSIGGGGATQAVLGSGMVSQESADAAAVAAGGGGSSSGGLAPGNGSGSGVYNMLLLEDLVLQQCYFPKVGCGYTCRSPAVLKS